MILKIINGYLNVKLISTGTSYSLTIKFSETEDGIWSNLQTLSYERYIKGKPNPFSFKKQSEEFIEKYMINLQKKFPLIQWGDSKIILNEVIK